MKIRSLHKKKFLFTAKVIFLETATLHLNNQNPQINLSLVSEPY